MASVQAYWGVYPQNQHRLCAGLSGLSDAELNMVAQLTDELSIEPLELEDCLNSMSSPPSDPATPCAPQCAHHPP